MKAVLFEAEYAPKKEYQLTDRELETRKIYTGSMVWKNPRVSLVDLPIPEPKGGEILLKVKACGYCGSDIHCYENDEEGYILYPTYVTSPIVLGHEFSGVVEQVGSDVVGFARGDMVAAEETLWCGECNACRVGLPNQCERIEEYGFTENGAMAEYMVVKAKYAWKINKLAEVYGDEGKAFEAGAMIEPAGVAYNALFVESGGLRPGADVAVFGTGPIGLFGIALARAAGAGKIIAFEINDTRAKLAKEFGADAVYSPIRLMAEGYSPADVMLELTDGFGVNLILEAAGVPHLVLPDASHALAADGKIVQVGRAPVSASINLEDFIRRGGTLHGSAGHSGQGIFRSVISLMAAGRIDLTPAITGRYSLDRAVDGFERLRSRNDAKLMVRM